MSESGIQRNEISFKELLANTKNVLSYLKSKWPWILIAAFVFGGLGFFYAGNKKPVYTATLSFALEDENGSGGGLGGALGLASQFGLDLGGGGSSIFTGANLIELMKSRSLVEKTLLTPVMINGKKESLANIYLNNSRWKTKWNSSLQQISFPIDGDRSKYSLQQDSILGLIYMKLVSDNISVNQKDKKVSILEINVRSENELFAKWLVEGLATKVSEFYIETKTKRAASNVQILQRQADSVRAELNSAITGVASANDNTFNLNLALNIKRTSSQKHQIDVQANTVILTELVKNLELAKVSLRRETPLIQVIDRPILPLNVSRQNPVIMAIFFAFLAVFFVSFFFILKHILANNFL